MDEPVSKWEPPLVIFCPRADPLPQPCECGYVGKWDRRWWYDWIEDPGRKPTALIAQRWTEAGLPVRSDGWWHHGGFDERCPGCGDIERFDWHAELIDRFREDADVVPFRRS